MNGDVKMKNFKFMLLLGCSLLGLTSCATPIATSPFTTKHENAWFIMHDQYTNESYPVYCMANKKEISADPVCFKSKNFGFDQPPKTDLHRR